VLFIALAKAKKLPLPKGGNGNGKTKHGRGMKRKLSVVVGSPCLRLFIQQSAFKWVTTLALLFPQIEEKKIRPTKNL